MRSILGEWSGNVRSTPTPNDCLRTVNVSRTPAPWRLSTTPSNTWTRRRWPSITWKWTRTVSPALNCGIPLRNWARSMESITLLIGRRPETGRGGMLAQRNPVRRPVGREDLADQILARNRPPAARVARLGAVVAHHEVGVVGDRLRLVRLEVAATLRDVRLNQPPPVDVHDAVALLPRLAGERNDPLDERPGGRALLLRAGRCVEDDDVPPLGILEVVDEAVREHPIGEAC